MPKPLSAATLAKLEQPPFVVPTQQSLWKGPVADGLTQTQIGRWLVCRERFRLKAVEGLSEDEPWEKMRAMEYGSLFHAAMEASSGRKDWRAALDKYYGGLLEKFPANESDITKWYLLAEMQFPIYLNHWKNHETERNRRPIFEEKAFKIQVSVNMPLAEYDPVITLQGKIDAAYESSGCVFLQENKTKGDIDQEGLSKTIDKNLQTLIYHLALRQLLPGRKIAGTLYNVIRRPLSDKYSPRKKKGETMKAFVARVGEKMLKEPQKHFYRWIVPLTDRQIASFRARCLDPILRAIVMWWDGFDGDPFSPEKNPFHFEFPFGVYHGMDRGFRGDFFDLLATGSRRGLHQITDLYPELK